MATAKEPSNDSEPEKVSKDSHSSTAALHFLLASQTSKRNSSIKSPGSKSLSSPTSPSKKKVGKRLSNDSTAKKMHRESTSSSTSAVNFLIESQMMKMNSSMTSLGSRSGSLASPLSPSKKKVQLPLPQTFDHDASISTLEGSPKPKRKTSKKKIGSPKSKSSKKSSSKRQSLESSGIEKYSDHKSPTKSRKASSEADSAPSTPASKSKRKKSSGLDTPQSTQSELSERVDALGMSSSSLLAPPLTSPGSPKTKKESLASPKQKKKKAAKEGSKKDLKSPDSPSKRKSIEKLTSSSGHKEKRESKVKSPKSKRASIESKGLRGDGKTKKKSSKKKKTDKKKKSKSLQKPDSESDNSSSSDDEKLPITKPKKSRSRHSHAKDDDSSSVSSSSSSSSSSNSSSDAIVIPKRQSATKSTSASPKSKRKAVPKPKKAEANMKEEKTIVIKNGKRLSNVEDSKKTERSVVIKNGKRQSMSEEKTAEGGNEKSIVIKNGKRQSNSVDGSKQDTKLTESINTTEEATNANQTIQASRDNTKTPKLLNLLGGKAAPGLQSPLDRFKNKVQKVILMRRFFAGKNYDDLAEGEKIADKESYRRSCLRTQQSFHVHSKLRFSLQLVTVHEIEDLRGRNTSWGDVWDDLYFDEETLAEFKHQAFLEDCNLSGGMDDSWTGASQKGPEKSVKAKEEENNEIEESPPKLIEETKETIDGATSDKNKGSKDTERPGTPSKDQVSPTPGKDNAVQEAQLKTKTDIAASIVSPQKKGTKRLSLFQSKVKRVILIKRMFGGKNYDQLQAGEKQADKDSYLKSSMANKEERATKANSKVSFSLELVKVHEVEDLTKRDTSWGDVWDDLYFDEETLAEFKYQAFLEECEIADGGMPWGDEDE